LAVWRSRRRRRTRVDESIRYGVDGNVLRIRLAGTYTIEDFLRQVDEALQAHGTPEKVALIIDRRRSHVDSNTPQELQRALEALFVWQKRMLCVAYVSSSDFYFDFIEDASRFAAFNNGPPVKPFRDIESAEDWVRRQTA
jgi:hypothetical protein